MFDELYRKKCHVMYDGIYFLKHFLNIYEKMLYCIDLNASLVTRLAKTVDFNCDSLAYIFLRKNYRAKGFKQHRNSF